MPSKRSAVLPVDDEVIVKSVVVATSPIAAFRMFTDAPALASWLCARAITDAAVGGRYELFWDPQDPQNDSTIGCRITAFDPGRLVAFQWRSPRQFKAFANAADPLTHVVVTFHGDTAGTVVTLVHSGWRSGDEWRQAARWQRVAWDHAFDALAATAGRSA